MNELEMHLELEVPFVGMQWLWIEVNKNGIVSRSIGMKRENSSQVIADYSTRWCMDYNGKRIAVMAVVGTRQCDQLCNYLNIAIQQSNVVTIAPIKVTTNPFSPLFQCGTRYSIGRQLFQVADRNPYLFVNINEQLHDAVSVCSFSEYT